MEERRSQREACTASSSETMYPEGETFGTGLQPPTKPSALATRQITGFEPLIPLSRSSEESGTLIA